MDETQKSTPGDRSQWPRWARPFLEAFRKTGNVTVACEAVGVKSRSNAWKLRRENEAFAAAWDDAKEQAVEYLEEEARRRAYEGVKRKKFTPKGEPIIDPETGEQYCEHAYSDTLLVTLLKANAPEKYRDRSNIDLTTGGKPIKVYGDVDLDQV